MDSNYCCQLMKMKVAVNIFNISNVFNEHFQITLIK